MTIEQLFSMVRNFDAKNVELNRASYPVEYYRNAYIDESAAKSYLVGFVGAGGRGAPLYYSLLSVEDMVSLATLSHTEKGQPIFRLDFSKMQREVLKGAFSVLCYNGQAAINEARKANKVQIKHGINAGEWRNANQGEAFEKLMEKQFPTFKHFEAGEDAHEHGDDFQTESGLFIGCKFADSARVMLSDKKQSAFENAYGMNPWHDAINKEED